MRNKLYCRLAVTVKYKTDYVGSRFVCHAVGVVVGGSKCAVIYIPIIIKPAFVFLTDLKIDRLGLPNTL